MDSGQEGRGIASANALPTVHLPLNCHCLRLSLRALDGHLSLPYPKMTSPKRWGVDTLGRQSSTNDWYSDVCMSLRGVTSK